VGIASLFTVYIWSSVLAVDDTAYNKLTSAHEV